jgi:hypothetical protein
MKLLGRLFVALLLLGNLLLLAGLSLHVVRSPGKTPALVAKDHLTLVDTLVDTSAWTTTDLATHAATVSRIVQAGKGDLLAHVAPTLTSAAQRDNSARKASAPEEPHQPTIFDFDKK